MAQVARNLTGVDSDLRSRRFLILDRDTKFTAQFRRILEDAGVQVVRTAFQAPNMNAIAERFVQSVKRECLERLILFGPGHLRRALNEFVAHYRIERPHQGLGNTVLTASTSEPRKGRGCGLRRTTRRAAAQLPAIGLTAARIAKVQDATTHHATGVPARRERAPAIRSSATTD